jgi:hypothetical protein
MVAEFPTNTTLIRLYEDEMPGQHPVTVSPRFRDGSRDFNLDADVKIRQWQIKYDGLTLVQAALLDDHVEAARYNDETGSAYSFPFTPRGGSVLANVRYAPSGYQRRHIKTDIQARDVILIKYP